MVDGKRVAVVVPAHDEERLIGTTLAGIPEFVDRILVVDDASTDGTAAAVRSVGDRTRRARLARAERRRRRRDRHRLRARARGGARHRLRDGGRQPDGPGRPAHARRAGRPRRGRLREGEPTRQRRGLEADPAHAVPRQRDPVAADEDRLRLLARGRLADGLHGRRCAHAGPARPRPRLSGLRLPERHAGASERLECARARLPLAPDLRRRRSSRESSYAGSCRGSRGCS